MARPRKGDPQPEASPWGPRDPDRPGPLAQARPWRCWPTGPGARLCEGPAEARPRLHPRWPHVTVATAPPGRAAGPPGPGLLVCSVPGGAFPRGLLSRPPGPHPGLARLLEPQGRYTRPPVALGAVRWHWLRKGNLAFRIVGKWRDAVSLAKGGNSGNPSRREGASLHPRHHSRSDLGLCVLCRRTVPYGLASYRGSVRGRRSVGRPPQSPRPPGTAPRCSCVDSEDKACTSFCARAPATGRYGSSCAFCLRLPRAARPETRLRGLRLTAVAVRAQEGGCTQRGGPGPEGRNAEMAEKPHEEAAAPAGCGRRDLCPRGEAARLRARGLREAGWQEVRGTAAPADGAQQGRAVPRAGSRSPAPHSAATRGLHPKIFAASQQLFPDGKNVSQREKQEQDPRLLMAAQESERCVASNSGPRAPGSMAGASALHAGRLAVAAFPGSPRP
ncbi:Endothelin-3 [Galemys pyrenaicus]|uniref:Endothelin-3 n=1 Tax=Galemys pyrenaicus TaxID=202257 RepID=A0A8J6DM24_GALPY|nr:Endothelin-3 [Galemys pyrenaicus]